MHTVMTEEQYLDYFKTLDPFQNSTVFSYKDDIGYRVAIRTLFCMNKSKYENYDGIPQHLNLDDFADDMDDAEMQKSLDELNYDSDAIIANMEILFKRTENEPVFAELYEFAAACMFSTDPSIGQSVLCSYDSLPRYFICLWTYLCGGGLDKMLALPEYKSLRLHFLPKGTK